MRTRLSLLFVLLAAATLVARADDPAAKAVEVDAKDKAALDVHAKANATRPPLPAELRVGTTEREDYQYNRTR